eukprot:SAG31_NODE_435_length_15733_cov_6.508251_3_plen_141_part_00
MRTSTSAPSPLLTTGLGVNRFANRSAQRRITLNFGFFRRSHVLHARPEYDEARAEALCKLIPLAVAFRQETRGADFGINLLPLASAPVMLRKILATFCILTRSAFDCVQVNAHTNTTQMPEQKINRQGGKAGTRPPPKLL